MNVKFRQNLIEQEVSGGITFIVACYLLLTLVLLRQMMEKRTKRVLDGTWIQEGGESVLKVVGTQVVRNYIGRRQATVAQWVALQPMFEVCVKQETSCDSGGQRQPLW